MEPEEQDNSGHRSHHSASRVGRSTGTRSGMGPWTIAGLGAGVAVAFMALALFLVCACLALVVLRTQV